MSTENRDVYGWAIAVVILSVFMGIVLTFTWEMIYSEVTTIEESLLSEVPGLSSGGIQIAAMFGLGLFLTWATLVMLDWRKRYQGMLLLLASGIILVVLALFDRFLPQMLEHPVQNVLAFIAGTMVALITETVRLPFRKTPGDLFYIAREESSLRPFHIVTTDDQEAEFSVAVGALYILIMSVVLGAKGALVLADASLGLLAITVVVSVIYAFALYRLFRADVTRADLDVEILGPTGSGKTLFFYGLWETVRDSDRYEPQSSNDRWRDTVKKIETRSDGWPTESTKEYYRLEFEFLYGKLNRNVEMVLNDYPGKDLSNIKHAIFELATDGGYDEREPSTPQPDGGMTSEDEGPKPDWAGDSETESESESESELGEEQSDSIAPDEDSEEQPEEDSDSEEKTNTEVLAKYIRKADIMLVIIDTRKVIESGFVGLDPDNYKGQVGEAETEPTEIDNIDDICREVEPKEVIAIATKADLLIDKYTKEEGENKPHLGSGDFDAFTEYVDDFFCDYTTFSDFKRTHDISTFYPVYFPTELDKNDEPVPVKKDGKLQPEGFEQVLDEIVRP